MPLRVLNVTPCYSFMLLLWGRQDLNLHFAVVTVALPISHGPSSLASGLSQSLPALLLGGLSLSSF